ncbi:hypothetical protein MLD38_013065 [Melastoma candidum]|uniref:Uncharacterized protein n=1 Tax=Melastoma candidum TaxID=119954 RepID=A0ACB9RA77_9MYRT|nr:hypothetical protein MLD38_013065 [Melastoma candidum]
MSLPSPTTTAFFLFFCVSSVAVLLLSETVRCETFLVDGIAQWKDPSVHVGDTVVFRHKYGYKLYIFRNEEAFSLCNFGLSTLLTKPNSPSYTWHPSRTGFFYFAFRNGSSTTCLDALKLPVELVVPSPHPPPDSQTAQPELPPMPSAPVPIPGGVVSSSPGFPWPFQPRDEVFSPGPSPGMEAPVGILPGRGGGGVPFINSNPAVPLPTGEVDSATIKPLPTSSGHKGVMGTLKWKGALFWGMVLLL